MNGMPEPPEGYEADIAFDDESIPLHVRRDEAERMAKLALREPKLRGLAWSKAEAQYYSAKAEETAELYARGYPATLVANLIKGQPKTNKLLERRLAEQIGYKNAVEAVNVYKLIARMLNDEIEREWGQARRM